MELTADLLSPVYMWGGFVIFIGGLLLTLWRLPWYWLARPGVANRFAATNMAIVAIWQLRADLDGGPSIHLLGATLLTLAFGWRLAVLGLTLVLVASTALGSSGWAALGVNGVVLVLLGIGSSYLVARASQHYLPGHLFVYFFVAAFFGAAITMALVSLAGIGVLRLSDMMHHRQILGNYLPTSLLLLFPEAFITGALITLTAIYRPAWLVSFSERHYLQIND